MRRTTQQCTQYRIEADVCRRDAEAKRKEIELYKEQVSNYFTVSLNRTSPCLATSLRSERNVTNKSGNGRSAQCPRIEYFFPILAVSLKGVTLHGHYMHAYAV